MQTVDPAAHEFAANYLFAEHGLAPFFAADSRIKAGDGKQIDEFTVDGERWIAKLYYQESGLVHPGNRTPTGTEFHLDELREFRLKIARHPEQDHVGEQSFNAHLAPRWPGLRAEKDNGSTVKIPVPDGFGEGVNVRIQGSNIEFRRYHDLLQRAVDAVGINDWYFDEPHPYSNVVDAERYVRLDQDRSGPVHARDGPIASMGHLLEDDRSGYRKIVQNDQDEDGRRLPGYYHTVTLGPKRVREAFPDHDLPREVKHYYAREAKSLPDDHPLSHPKVGVSYQVSRWDETVGVEEDDLAALERQLDQTVMSVLADAGVQIHVGEDDPFVEDAYFEPENVERAENWLYALDLTHVRQEQESVVVRYLADGGFSPVQFDALKTLVADGGEVSPTDIADEHDWHPGSVRRALRDMEEFVEREYDRVALKSPFIAELVHDAIQEAIDGIDRAVSTSAKVIEGAERGLDETTSAFLAWAAKHDVDVNDEREARMTLRMSKGECFADTCRRIAEGFAIWKQAGRDIARFRSADVRFNDGSGGLAARYIDAR